MRVSERAPGRLLPVWIYWHTLQSGNLTIISSAGSPECALQQTGVSAPTGKLDDHFSGIYVSPPVSVPPLILSPGRTW